MNSAVVISAMIMVAGTAQADIKAYCIDKWQDNYEMQEYCLNNQREANGQMFDFAEANNLVHEEGTLSPSSNGGVAERLLYNCMVKWQLKKFNTYNYEMVVYCTDNQVKAYNRMNADSIPSSNSKSPGSLDSPHSKVTVTIKSRPGESVKCTQARQHLADLKGAGLSGTSQYERTAAIVALCK